MTQAEALAHPITLERLLALADRVEVIDERTVEMPGAGGLHQLIARNLYRMLDAFVAFSGLGEVFFDGLLYLMYSDDRHLKNAFIPDVSFIRRENIPRDWQIEKPHPGVPDLAIEVISPGDDAGDVQDKVRVYLATGTQEVWLVYPRTSTLHQYRRDAPDTVRVYTGAQPIDAGALFPGLTTLTPDAIFALPDWLNRPQP